MSQVKLISSLPLAYDNINTFSIKDGYQFFYSDVLIRITPSELHNEYFIEFIHSDGIDNIGDNGNPVDNPYKLETTTLFQVNCTRKDTTLEMVQHMNDVANEFHLQNCLADKTIRTHSKGIYSSTPYGKHADYRQSEALRILRQITEK